ncbi:MAG: Omp28 family outer membrane lipoprotein [Bacteroidales bacterium]
MILKKINIVVMLFLGVAFLLGSACDEIDPPYKETVNFESKDTVRNVLLEEFTGHLCVNCPSAAKELHNLKDIYGDNLVLVSIHAGFFAQTQAAPYDYDFTTVAGEAINSQFNVQSNPLGIVSRVNSGGTYKRDVSEWSFYVDSLVNATPLALMDISTNYDPGTREVSIDISATALETLEGDYNLSVIITEDSIVKPQKNNNSQVGPTPDILDYVHMHVLRGAVNGDWGDNYFSGPVQPEDPLPAKQYTYQLHQEWEAAQCHVIAYIYRTDNNDGTEYEVIQVLKNKVIE